LASSRGTYSSPDIQDVAVNLLAFEEINRCQIIISLTVVGEPADRQMSIGAVARELESVSSDQPVLASVSAICSGMNVRSLEGALIHILYTLDGEIASREMHFGKNGKR
jgi:hypothetical protein